MSLIKPTIWKGTIASLLVIAGFIMFVQSKQAEAQITPLINFIGKVTEIDGDPISDGTYNLEFSLYNTPTGGAAVWTETLNATTCFSGFIDSVASSSDGVVYGYLGESATTTFKIGQYLTNASSTASTSDSVLIVDYDAAAKTVTVASGSPEWNVGEGINNRPIVEGGVINVHLGTVADISNVNFGQELYLEIVFNGETMQPRKLFTSVPHAFESAQLGGRTEDEFGALADNETVTGEWSFENILSVSSSSASTLLSVTQNGTGNIVEFKRGGATAFAVLADDRVQIGNYLFPTTHGTAGYVLKTDISGNLYWDVDYGGLGGSGLWATSTNNLLMRQVDPAQVVVIGNVATSAPGYILEVQGSSLFDNLAISDHQQLRLYDTGNTNYLAIRATSSLAGNFVLTLPNGYGTDGLALVTDGNGNLRWDSPTSYVYNNAGLSGQISYYEVNGQQLSGTSTLFISPVSFVGIGTTAPSGLLTVGSSNGSQFIVNSIGEVVGGVWKGDIIGADYGGIGTSSTAWTGLPFVNTGSWSPTSTLSAVYGGTGISVYAIGDIVFAGSANTLEKLSIGSSSDLLVVSPSGRPSWVATTSLGLDIQNMTGILDALHGGTGQDFSLATGYLYFDSGTAMASGTLAISYTDLQATTPLILTSNVLSLGIVPAVLGGTGTTTASWTGVPFVTAGAWSATSSLSVQYGGTGLTNYPPGGLVYGNSGGTLSTLNIGGTGDVLVVSPGGTPFWVATTSLGLDIQNMTGILGVANGGTGQDFTGANGFLYFNAGTAIASQTIAVAYTNLAAGDGVVLASNLLTLDRTGNWSGTFDSQEGSYYLNALNLNNFGLAFAGQLAATTTSALAEGLNLYWTDDRFNAAFSAKDTDDLSEGSNLYWTDDRFDGRLSGTSTLPSLTTLANLSTVGIIANGTWQGDILSVQYGGTGTSTFEANSVLYASANDTVGEILAGMDGYVLKMLGGIPVWQPDLTVGGESSLWATSTDNLRMYPSNIAKIVIIGAQATSSLGTIFEVAGNSFFSGSISAQSLSLVNALAVSSGGTGSSTPSGILYGDGAGNIVSLPDNSTNWNTAYSWGDHSGQNYFDKDTDVLAVALGGTGTSTFMANSLLYASSTNAIGEIPAGLPGYALVMQGGVPTWSSTTPGVAHEVLSSQHAGVEATSTVYQGDLLHVNAGGDWSRLGLGSTGYILRSNGTDVEWSSTVNLTELGTVVTGTWHADTLEIAYGGTGATTATGARENLGLDDIYKFGVNSTGTVGWIWQSDGDGRGQWVATTSLGIVTGSGKIAKFIGTTTATTDGSFSSGGFVGYLAANDMCASEYLNSHFCRTHEILQTIEQDDIADWSGDVVGAWIAEGPPGYTYDSNDCRGWTDNGSTKLGAFWLYDDTGGGAGWLVGCSNVKPLSCCVWSENSN